MSIDSATPELVAKWLRHPSEKKRVLGVRSIRQVSPVPNEAAGRLVTAFTASAQDESRSVKEAVAEELAQLGGEIGLQALLACADDAAVYWARLFDLSVYHKMEAAVERCLNGEAQQILLAGLRSKSKYTRRLAAHAISKRPDAAHLPPLFDALYAVGEDYPTGQKILTAIAAIGDNSAMPELTRLLYSSEIDVPLRGQLALAIASLGGGGADAPAVLKGLNYYNWSYVANQDKAFALLTAELRRQRCWKDLARSLTGCAAHEMARSLAAVTDPEFGHELVQLLVETPSIDTQSYIIELLKNIHTTEVASALLQIVVVGAHSRESFRSDLAENVRISALLAAGGMAGVCESTQVSDLFENFLEKQVLLYELHQDNVFTHRTEDVLRAIGSINSSLSIPLMVRVFRSTYMWEAQTYGDVIRAYNLSLILVETLRECGGEISPEDWELIDRCS